MWRRRIIRSGFTRWSKCATTAGLRSNQGKKGIFVGSIKTARIMRKKGLLIQLITCDALPSPLMFQALDLILQKEDKLKEFHS